MDKIIKQVNIETIKSHTPGVLPYIPYAGNDFIDGEKGNWGGFPINIPNSNGSIESYSEIIRRLHEFESIIKNGIKVKQIRPGVQKYTPKFKETFNINGDNIADINDFRIDSNRLYIPKEVKFDKEYLILIKDYKRYNEELGGYLEYSRLLGYIGVLAVDNTIQGDLVPNFLYFATIQPYLDLLYKYEAGDCCNKKKYEAMGGDKMKSFLESKKEECKPPVIDYDGSKQYFFLPISKDNYEGQVDTDERIFETWDELTAYISGNGISKETSEYLKATLKNEKFTKIFYFKKYWRSELTPTLNIPLSLVQNTDDIGVLNGYENEKELQTVVYALTLDGATNNIPYFFNEESGEYELAKYKWLENSPENALLCWKDDESYFTESKLELLRTREKFYSDEGELKPYLRNTDKEAYERIPFKSRELYVDGKLMSKGSGETFNDTFLYDFFEGDKRKLVYSCDYIDKVFISKTEGTIKFEYCIGAEYIVEDDITCEIEVTDGIGKLIDYTVEFPEEGGTLTWRVKSSCHWDAIIIEEGEEKEIYLNLYDANGIPILPDGNIIIDPFNNEVNLKIESNTNWSIVGKNCSITPKSGKNNSGIVVKIVNSIEDGEYITINYGERNEYQQKYYIKQETEKYIRVKYGDTYIEDSELNVDALSAIYDLYVETNTSWSIGASGNWSDLYALTLVGKKNHILENEDGRPSIFKVHLNVLENTLNIVRDGFMIFTHGTYSLRIPIIQEAADFICVYTNNKGELTRELTLDYRDSFEDIERAITQWAETNVSTGWTVECVEEPFIYISQTRFEFENTATETQVDIFWKEGMEILIDIEYMGRAEGESYDIQDGWCDFTKEGKLTIQENINNENRYCTIYISGWENEDEKNVVRYKINVTQKK